MLLHARDLSRSPGGRILFAGLAIDLPQAGSLAITGPSGCGKSTLLRLLAGREAPDGGKLRWDGEDPRNWSNAERRRRIGWLDQYPHLEGRLSTAENVRLAAAFRSFPDAVAQAAALLEQVGLQGHADQLAATLSGGQRVRAALARTLFGQPLCLIVDEPTASLDEEHARHIADLLLAVCAQRFTLIVATHDRQLAERCDQQVDLA